ncbi:hypothetical protein AB6A40_011362 [Gnathostoma spinigerum]|uniref:Uncharacterized protein n=1 Tax=Gnathostoma spinigerum TaxID=75299 RepID=A0ABD6EXF7_9BILA
MGAHRSGRGDPIGVHGGFKGKPPHTALESDGTHNSLVANNVLPVPSHTGYGQHVPSSELMIPQGTSLFSLILSSLPPATIRRDVPIQAAEVSLQGRRGGYVQPDKSFANSRLISLPVVN